MEHPSLIRIQQRDGSLIIHLDPPTLLLITIPKRQLPPTLTLRRRQPQPHKMAARCRGRMVRIFGAGMQNVRVRDELDVADLEDHVQGVCVAGFF